MKCCEGEYGAQNNLMYNYLSKSKLGADKLHPKPLYPTVKFLGGTARMDPEREYYGGYSMICALNAHFAKHVQIFLEPQS